MGKSIIPELRPYLERILDEELVAAGLKVRDARKREMLLSHFQEQFERLLLYRLMMTLPAIPRQQFASLIEHDASDEELKVFITSHLSDIPDFVQEVFQEFRQQRANLMP